MKVAQHPLEVSSYPPKAIYRDTESDTLKRDDRLYGGLWRALVDANPATGVYGRARRRRGRILRIQIVRVKSLFTSSNLSAACRQCFNSQDQLPNLSPSRRLHIYSPVGYLLKVENRPTFR